MTNDNVTHWKFPLPTFLRRKSYPSGFIPVKYNNLTSDVATLLQYFGSRLSKSINCTTQEGQWKAYQDCSLIESIIERRVDYFHSGIYSVVDTEGKPVTNAESKQILRLLANPNPLQNRAEFEQTVMVYKEVFGFCPLYKVMPANRTKGLPVAIWAINPMNFTYTLTGKLYLQSTLSGIVKEIRFMNPAGDAIVLNTEEQYSNIWILNGSTPKKDDLFTSQSPLYPCGELVSNFQVAVNVYGTLLKQSILGIISNRTTDKMGHQQLDGTDKSDVNEKLIKRYGLIEERDNFVVTNANLFFQSMLTNIGQLQIPDCLKISVNELCNRLGFQVELLSNKDITFENKRSAEIMQYQNHIIPFSQNYCESLTDFLLGEESTISITKSFAHLPILQKNKKEEADTMNVLVTSYGQLYKDGLITRNQYLSGIGLPEIPEGNLYITQADNTPLAIKYGVGGTQAIQSILLDATLTPEQKKNILIILFNLTPEQAAQMTGR